MSPADRAALEIGHMFMNLIGGWTAAEQQAQALAQQVVELEAQVKEFSSGVEKPKVAA